MDGENRMSQGRQSVGRRRLLLSALLFVALGQAHAQTVYRADFVPGYDSLKEQPDSDVIPPQYLAPLGFWTFRWDATLEEVNDSTHLLQYVYVRGVKDDKVKQVYKDRCRDAPKDEDYSCLSEKPAQARLADARSMYSVVVAEYRLELPFLLHDTDAYLHRVSFQFCSSYFGARELDRMRNDASRLIPNLRLCGVRLYFSKQLLPGSPIVAPTNPERVLRAAIRAFGQPVQADPTEWSGSENLERYSWCASMVGKHYSQPLNCPANVVYAYDRTSEQGVVLLATPMLYAYLGVQIKLFLEEGQRIHDHYMSLLVEPTFRVSRYPFICQECGPEDAKFLGRPGDLKQFAVHKPSKRQKKPEPAEPPP